MVEVGLGDPEVTVGQRRALVGLPKPEVGIEHAVGEDVLDAVAQQNGATRNTVGGGRFVEPLPDVAGRAAVEGRLAVIANIDIGEVALLDFQRALLDGEFTDTPLAEGHTGFL